MGFYDDPPAAVVQLALKQAARSVCAKSKRGVVIWSPSAYAHRDPERPPGMLHDGVFGVKSVGFNGPPLPFTCDQSTACAGSMRALKNCNRVSIHAEERALHDLWTDWYRRHDSRYDLDLLHVKAVDGALVASGPPSCDSCSKQILERRLGHVWLFEAQTWIDYRACHHCDSKHDEAELAKLDLYAPDACPKCWNELAPTTTRVYDERSGLWVRYTALEFHEATMKNCGLYAARRGG